MEIDTASVLNALPAKAWTALPDGDLRRAVTFRFSIPEYSGDGISAYNSGATRAPIRSDTAVQRGLHESQ